MEISKRDWKLYREKLSARQENYMDHLINSGSLTNRSRLTGAIRE